jgi:hypothetical protein
MLKSHIPSKAATGSLVALIASISATGAFADVPRVHPGGPDRELSARIASIAATIEQKESARLRDVLHAGMKVAQWRN